jgi:hypothetical protein
LAAAPLASALITLSVMSMRGLMKTASPEDDVVLSARPTCLDHALRLLDHLAQLLVADAG